MLRADKVAANPPVTPPATGAAKQAFVERLQTILTHWPSADRLARSMGVSPSAFRKWLKGEAEPSRERLVALAHATGVGVAWLAEGEGPEPVFDPVGGNRSRTGIHVPSDEADWSDYVLLPRRPEAAAAGGSTPAPPSGSAFMALRHDWVRSVCGVDPARLVLETAVGESMTPTIRDGNTMLIDSTVQTFRNFGIYVLEINGERLVKRVQRKHDGSLVLISDNSVYQADIVTKEAAGDVTVVGRVVWVGGTV
ncbi:MAG: S24 family peptidase [Rhodopila sp.]|jgi:phage repressor protein C with HTH and peptisase S24 domain